MRIDRARSTTRRALVALVAAAMALTLAACGGSDDDDAATSEGGIKPTGTDDGSKLTLWTRAPLEKQAKLLVDAYNASHKNQVQLTIVPNDDYVAKVGAAAGSDDLPDLFAADIVYVPNWTKQGLFQDITEQIDGLAFKDTINKGHLTAGTATARSTFCRSCSTCRCSSGTRSCTRRRVLTRRRRRRRSPSSPTQAKKIQALDKPDTYGTATGLNCGGCLVFTWFPVHLGLG